VVEHWVFSVPPRSDVAVLGGLVPRGVLPSVFTERGALAAKDARCLVGPNAKKPVVHVLTGADVLSIFVDPHKPDPRVGQALCEYPPRLVRGSKFSNVQTPDV